MQPSGESIWTAAQDHLRSMLSGDTYNLWFAPLRVCAQENNTLVLEVANDFCEVWLKENYMGLLQDVIGLASGRHLQIKFKVASITAADSQPAAPVVLPAKTRHAESAAEKAPLSKDLAFNPRNTFDTFVVGNNNNFAYAAALAVAQAPA